METSIDAGLGRRIDVRRGGLSVVDTHVGDRLSVALTPEDRVALRDALGGPSTIALRRERDKWKSRAEAAEQLIPAYAMLDVWSALGRDALGSDSIHFDDWHDERGYADAWAELTAAVREAAEARTAPAVTRDDIEKVIDQTLEKLVHGDYIPRPAADAVWSLVSGDDPAVHVVRESELPTVNHPSHWRNFDLADGTWRFRDATDVEIREALEAVESDLRYLLVVSRAIEAGQDVDPVEDAAVAAFKAAWHRADEEGDEGNRVRRGIRAARHVLGQEAKR